MISVSPTYVLLEAVRPPVPLANKTSAAFDDLYYGGIRSRRGLVEFALYVVYFLGITLLRPTPILSLTEDMSFQTAFLVACLPLIVGLTTGRPSGIAAGFLAGCLGPFNTVSVVLGIAVIAGVAVYLAIRYRRSFKALLETLAARKAWVAVLLPAYATVLWFFRLGDTSDMWSYVLGSSSLFAIPVATYSLLFLNWNRQEIVRMAVSMTLILAALTFVVLLYPALGGAWEQYIMGFYTYYKAAIAVHPLPFFLEWVRPDYNWASVASSHYLAVILMMGFVLICTAAARKGRRLVFGIAALAFWLAFSMAENAHAFFGAMAGIGIIVLWKLHRLSRFRNAGYLASFSSLSIIMVATMAVVVGIYGPYGILSDTQKSAFYRFAIEYALERPLRIAAGEGVGTFAGKVSERRATYDNELSFAGVSLNVPKYSSETYRKGMEYVHSAKAGGTMELPRSGLIAVLFETGAVGLIIILAVLISIFSTLWRVYRDYYGVIVVRGAVYASVFGLAVVCVSQVFRPYLEYTEVMVVLSLFLLLVALFPTVAEAARLTPARG